jgi:hypothetical protein
LKFLLLICFFLQAKVTGQVQVAVEGVRLGMTAEAVIEKLGKDYDLVDTIGKSVAEGDHFYLLYRKKQGDVAVFFRFGRVWTVTGYRFTKGSDAVLSNAEGAMLRPRVACGQGEV